MSRINQEVNSEFHEEVLRLFNLRRLTIEDIVKKNSTTGAIGLLNALMDVYVQEQKLLLDRNNGKLTEGQFLQAMKIGEAAALCLLKIIELEGKPPLDNRKLEFFRESIHNISKPDMPEINLISEPSITVKTDGTYPDRSELEYVYLIQYGNEIIDRETLIGLLEVLDELNANNPSRISTSV